MTFEDFTKFFQEAYYFDGFEYENHKPVEVIVRQNFVRLSLTYSKKGYKISVHSGRGQGSVLTVQNSDLDKAMADAINEYWAYINHVKNEYVKRVRES